MPLAIAAPAGAGAPVPPTEAEKALYAAHPAAKAFLRARGAVDAFGRRLAPARITGAEPDFTALPHEAQEKLVELGLVEPA